MARSRKIEHQAALDATQDLFWKSGYSGVSTREIEEKTGLTRFTLQTSYGGKKALFIDALDNYLANIVTEILPRPTSNILESIAIWFEEWSNPENLKGDACDGCLMLNTIVEFERGDPEIDARITEYFALLHQCFGSALKKAKDLGEVSSGFDVAGKTEIIIGSLIALSLVLRGDTRENAGHALSSAIVTMIREWRV